ncbi:MAG: YihY/virulence factor BrkB family protein, partial [Ktedonobacteraceae bacterium]
HTNRGPVRDIMGTKVILQDTRTFENFWLKCMNDWVFNFASALAYSLLMAMLPIVIALAAVVGFMAGNLSHQVQNNLIVQLNAIFPSIIGQQGQSILDPTLVLTLLRQNAGFLSILAIVLAIFNGSRLFVALEDYFDIIYHTPARSFWRQNLMAISMLLIFIILVPIMVLASSSGLGGFLGGLLASWLLFQAVFMIVPNQQISLRNSWLGALVAAIALQVYVAIFPLYVGHFMSSYSGATGFAVILLLFFYYFAVILLLGAEVNAFYSENVRGTPANIAMLVHQATLVSDQQELTELAQEKTQRHVLKQ